MIEVMKQALEALKGYRRETNEAAITALRAAIAEAEKQEPVAWVNHGENRITRATGWDWYGALYTHPPRREWVGLTDEDVMVAAYQAGFDIHEDYDNDDDPKEMHWWTPDGEVCDDSLLKLRDIIEAKLKERNT